MTDQWEQIHAEIEDLLVPGLQLDAWERSLYYHLLRHTRLKGLDAAMFAVAPLSKTVSISDFKVRDVLRSLHRKGCVRIEDRSRNGHLVAVLLPSEISGLPRQSDMVVPLDLEALDFFTGRRYVAALLARQEDACFYCLKRLTKDTCELDHLVPQALAYQNSYRNIVVACHGCNKAKGEMAAADFMRGLYRDGVLNEAELRVRLATLAAVQGGELVPEIEGEGVSGTPRSTSQAP